MNAKGISNLALIDKGTFGGRSEEGCLLGRDEYGSTCTLSTRKTPPQ